MRPQQQYSSVREREEKYRSRAMENSGLVSSRFYPLLFCVVVCDEYIIEHIEREREREVSAAASELGNFPFFVHFRLSLSFSLVQSS